jgi:transposase
VHEDEALPDAARTMLGSLGEQIARVDAEIAAVDKCVMAQHKANPVSRLLAEIPPSGRSPRLAWPYESIPRSSAPAGTSPSGWG